MAIAVEKNGINIKGTKAMVEKTIGNNPRRISKIDIELTFLWITILKQKLF